MRIENLRVDDIDAAMDLSVQAGWNQIEADWQRLLDLAPDDCFAGWVDSELVATASLVTFDDSVGWIGMVLVDEDHRRQGFGMQIFEHALAKARAYGLPEIGLDATKAGRAVYQQVGFVDVAPIERWHGTLDPTPTEAYESDIIRNPPLRDVQSIDRSACGVDRSTLLTHLAEETGVRVFLYSDPRTETDQGYAIVRPGRNYVHIGPVVAKDLETFTVLLDAVRESFEEPRVILDVFIDDTMRMALEDANLEKQRRLTRMTYGDSVRSLMGDTVMTATGFELG